MRNPCKILLLAFACCATAPAPAPTRTSPTQASAEAAPPVARRLPEVTELHGQKRVDDYAWMKKKGTKEIEDYLKAETEYSSRWMERTASLRDTLYKEMLGRVQETDSDAPYPLRGYEYYGRTETGKQYRIHARRKLPDG
jgi:oligopeptidase B